MHVVLDACVIIFSYVLAWYLRFKSGLFQQDPWFLSLHEYMGALLYIVPGYLMLYYLFQLYTPKRVRGRRLEAWNILQANTIGLMVFTFVLYIIEQANFSRKMIAIFFCVNIVTEIFMRNLVRHFLRDMRKRGYNQKHMILIGYSRAAEQYIDRIKANPEWGYTIRGILDDNQPRGMEYKGVKVIGTIEI